MNNMTSQAAGEIEITVSHGPDKHIVSVPAEATVGDLSLTLEGLTGVPVGGQKIINRGKTLGNSDQQVIEAGLKNGSKLMLIGKKYNPEEDENYRQISEVEKKIVSLAKKQTDLAEELSGVEKGYLQKDLESNSLSSLGKRLAVCHEGYVRLLEKLDSLDLTTSNQSIRMKRKGVIKEIQNQLDSNDAITSTIHKLQDNSDS